MNNIEYVLITAARNEEKYIEKTIKSVVAQKILPKKWVIVNDGSTDSTDEIVQKYLEKYDFIQLVQISNESHRNFGSKARAIGAGYEQLKDITFDFIGNLDADISFDPYYYKRILLKFERNKKLGLAGGIRYDLHNGKFEKVVVSRNSVGGPFQFFRRQCYEDIGGYVPLEEGGIDTVAEVMARMHEWEVETFPEISVFHHRSTGTATGKIFRTIFNYGVRDYMVGYHPIFEFVRCLLRIRQRPYFLRAFLEMYGYCWAFIKKYKRPIPDDVVKYLRSEQKDRLRSLFLNGKDDLLKL